MLFTLHTLLAAFKRELCVLKIKWFMDKINREFNPFIPKQYWQHVCKHTSNEKNFFFQRISFSYILLWNNKTDFIFFTFLRLSDWLGIAWWTLGTEGTRARVFWLRGQPLLRLSHFIIWGAFCPGNLSYSLRAVLETPGSGHTAALLKQPMFTNHVLAGRLWLILRIHVPGRGTTLTLLSRKPDPGQSK